MELNDIAKYLYEIKTIPWYGKTKKRRVLNVDKYEFLIYFSFR